MVYRVQVDISFTDETEMNKFVNKIKANKDKFAQATVKPDPVNGVPRYITTHHCGHDTTPSGPCTNYVNVDIS